MIVELLVTALVAVVSAVGGLFGSVAVPEWVDAISGVSSELAGYAAGFGNWFPIADAIIALSFVVACTLIGFGIKLVRIVASFLTAGGGSAA